MTKEALLRFTVVLFFGQANFQWSAGELANIKITIFKTQLLVLPESLHMDMSIENIVCVHRIYKKEGF